MIFRKLVILFSVFILLSACKTQDTPAHSSTNAAQPASTASASVPKDVAAKVLEANLAKLDFKVDLKQYREGLFPVTVEPRKIKVAGVRGAVHSSLKDVSFFKKMEALTNVSIEWVEIPDATAQEKKNLMLASGEKLPDAFYAVGLMNDYDIATYGPSGVFEDFTKYMNLMPNFSKVAAQRPEIIKILKFLDGKLYTLPYIEEMEGITFVNSVHFINKDWLDRVGLKVPETIEEYEAALLAFKEKDANGNGNPDDEIPLSGNSNGVREQFNYLYGAFGCPDNNQHIAVKDKKVFYTASMEEYKQAIKWMNKLYSQGLIDPEAFTQDSKQFNAKAAAGTYGAFLTWRTTAIMSEEAAKSYVAVPPLKGPSGQKLWSRENVGEFIKSAFVMTKDAADKELIVKWVDVFYDPVVSHESNWGTYGLVQTKNDEGLWRSDYSLVPKDQNFSEWRDRNRIKGPSANLNDIYGKYCVMDAAGASRIEILKKEYFAYIPKEFYPPIYYSVADSKKINSIATELNTYVKEMHAKWITKGGIDQDWSSYLKNLEKIGLPDMLKIMQQYLDKYLSAQ